MSLTHGATYSKRERKLNLTFQLISALEKNKAVKLNRERSRGVLFSHRVIRKVSLIRWHLSSKSKHVIGMYLGEKSSKCKYECLWGKKYKHPIKKIKQQTCLRQLEFYIFWTIHSYSRSKNVSFRNDEHFLEHSLGLHSTLPPASCSWKQ